MNINRTFRKFAYNDTLEYSNVLPEGIAETDKNGKKLVYRTVSRNGENILRQDYVCLFLKSEKEAFISLEQDLVEVRTKDGQILCSVNRKEWGEELANIYYNEESYDNTFEHAGKLPEGIAETDKEGNKLLYRIANRRGENVLMQGYICLFLKSEKEAYINLEQDLVEVRTKDGQVLCSVNRKEWNEELANIYYNEESKEQNENSEPKELTEEQFENFKERCAKNLKVEDLSYFQEIYIYFKAQEGIYDFLKFTDYDTFEKLAGDYITYRIQNDLDMNMKF